MNNSISAENQLQISYSAESWQLISTELDTPTTLLQATPEGLFAHPVFVQARNLPSATLSPAQIARIILGYAPENEAWRLGMLLLENTGTKLDTLSMQWCELAHWKTGTYINGDMRVASQSLARLINRPFQFIEPHTKTRVPAFADPETQVASGMVSEDKDKTIDLPLVPLQKLPITVKDTRLVLTGEGIMFERATSWWLRSFVRMIVYAVVFVLFIILAIGSQSNGFAGVEPEWLPTAGIGIAVVIFANLLWLGNKLLRASNVVIDTHRREIYSQGIIFPFVNWRVAFDEIDFIVLSQTPAKSQGRPTRDAPMNIEQDVWIHAANGDKFYEILSVEDVTGKSYNWDNVRRHDHHSIRRQLFLAEYDTPAHHAATHIAERIDVPLYLDIQ